MPFSIDAVFDAFAGVVVDVEFVDGYVYAAVDDGHAVRWCVSLHKPLRVGDAVDVRAFGNKHDFHSNKLGRTFAELWFVVVTPRTEPLPQGESP